MRFGDWVKLVFIAFGCFVVAFIVFAIGVGASEGGDEGAAIWFVLAGLAIMFGGPWMGFLSMRSDSKCAECGKKWSLEKNGYRDGNITELHERGSGSELRLVHKWDRYQDWKCKNCGDETTQVIEQKKTV